MTKKHFEAIAEILRKAQERESDVSAAVHVIDRIADDFAAYCSEQNDNFDRVRFLDACMWY
jgi:hypothetical protein